MNRSPFAAMPPPVQRRALWCALGATILSVAAIAIAGRGLGVKIAKFELAGSRAAADALLAAWGEAGRSYLELSLWLDFPLIASYVMLLGLACAAIPRAVRGARTLSLAGHATSWLALLAGAFDVVENLALFRVLHTKHGDAAPTIAAICASAKFALLAPVLAFALLGGTYAAVRRWFGP